MAEHWRHWAIRYVQRVQRVLDAGDLRQNVCIGFIAYAGCREEALGDIEGKNGLRLRDLPELKIQDRKGNPWDEDGVTNGIVSFSAMPMRVIVRAGLSKARHQYETFLNADARQSRGDSRAV